MTRRPTDQSRDREGAGRVAVSARRPGGIPGVPGSLASRWLHVTATITASALLVGLLASCNVSPQTTSNQTADFTGEVFPEDAEPAVAALDYTPNELLVQPFPGATPAEVNDAVSRAGASVVETMHELDLTVLRVNAGDLASAATKLVEGGVIEGVQKNYEFQAQAIPDDTLFDRQDYLELVRLPEAWDITTGDPDVIIAVLDSGVYVDHTDLSNKVIGGWNVLDDDDNYGDAYGHGTLVSGVAAANSNNGIGVTGVAWDSRILAVRIADDNGKTTSRDIAAGILWAASHGAKVINVSYAPLWANKVVRSAAQVAWQRGSLVVISAGNAGGMTMNRGYPEAMFVGAVTGEGTVAAFSDRGAFVDVAAPGSAIETTAVGDVYDLTNGTSFSAPIVSGVAALAWSINPNFRPATIMQMIVDHAIDVGTAGRDNEYGHGLVDAAATLLAAMNTIATDDTTAPSVTVEAPEDGDSLTKRTLVKIDAEDESGVADVTLLVDGVAVAVDSRSPYRIVLDPSRFEAGQHVLGFVATDVIGNASAPLAIDVVFGPGEVTPAGKVTFTSPASGSTVSGDVTIEATLSAEAGLATAELLVDGTSVWTTAVSGTETNITYLWPSGGYAAGAHTLAVILTDALGRRTTGDISLITN